MQLPSIVLIAAAAAAAAAVAVAAPTLALANGTDLQWCNSQRYDPILVGVLILSGCTAFCLTFAHSTPAPITVFSARTRMVVPNKSVAVSATPSFSTS
jgi:hypothetical protein